MDVSKLPRFSKTEPPQPGQSDADAPRPPAAAPVGPDVLDYHAGRRAGMSVAAEAWISIALGVIIVLVFRRPLDYLLTRHHPAAFTWSFNDENGNPISYIQSAFFLPDIGVLAFGLMLVLDGLLLIFARGPVPVLLSFLLTLAVIALNVVAVTVAYNPIGFQLVSALAVAFGGYLAFHQWQTLDELRAMRRPPPK